MAEIYTPVSIFDIDGTTAYSPGFDHITDVLIPYQVQQNRISQGDLRQLQSLIQTFSLGKISIEEFSHQAQVQWASSLRSQPWHDLKEDIHRLIKDGAIEIYPYIKPTIGQLREDRQDIIIVTYNADFFAAAIAEEIGADGYIATAFQTVDQGYLTRHCYPFHGDTVKRKIIAQKFGAVSNVFGNDIPDINMMALADHGYLICTSTQSQFDHLPPNTQIIDPFTPSIYPTTSRT